MIASARSSCSLATASSPWAASSSCVSERSSPSTGAVTATGWSSAVARRAHPPRLLTTSAPRRIPPPCSINFRVVVVITLSCQVPSGTARNSRPRVKRRSIIAGGVPPPIPASPASLLQQPHGEDLHSPVDSLHHVVDGEQRDGYRRQRLHLHARPSHRLGGSPYSDSRQGLVQRRLDLHMVEPYRVAQRDQFRRALRRHRTCDLAHRENVALDHRLLRHEAVGFGRHPDRALRRRRADRDGLVGDVHHPSPARRVEVRQLHRGDPRSSPSTAATRCGLRLPVANSRASSTRAMADTTFPESFPARASLRNRASSSSSIAANAPRAWNGWRPSAKPRRPTGPLCTACRNRSAPSP